MSILDRPIAPATRRALARAGQYCVALALAVLWFTGATSVFLSAVLILVGAEK